MKRTPTAGSAQKSVARAYECAPARSEHRRARLGAKHVPIPVAEALENAVLPQVAILSAHVSTNDEDGDDPH